MFDLIHRTRLRKASRYIHRIVSCLLLYSHVHGLSLGETLKYGEIDVRGSMRVKADASQSSTCAHTNSNNRGKIKGTYEEVKWSSD